MPASPDISPASREAAKFAAAGDRVIPSDALKSPVFPVPFRFLSMQALLGW